MNVPELLTILAAIAGMLGFLYIVFIGQEPLAQWLEHRRRKANSSQLTQVRSAIDTSHSKPVKHNLPGRNYGRFINRELERMELTKRLQPYPDSDYHLVSIDGIGGIGKSALALEVAHDFVKNADAYLAGHRFDAIVWLSAKQSILTTSEGVTRREGTLDTLQDLIATMAIVLEREDVIRAPEKLRLELVRKALTHQRTLIIVDNFEAVDDEAVYAFLQELPAPTKAIITTRRRIDIASPIRLRGMSWKDAELFIAHQGEIRGTRIERQDARKLYERTGGIPLAIEWSVAQIALGYSTDTVLARLRNAESDVVRFTFGETIRAIENRQAYFALIALALFPEDASDAALKCTLDHTEMMLTEDALAELESLSLVTRRSGRTAILPTTRSFALSLLDKLPDFRGQAVSRLVQFYCDYAQTRSGKASETTFRELERELLNIDTAIGLARQTGDWRAVANLAISTDYFLEMRGFWGRRLHFADLLIEAGHALDEHRIIGMGNLAASNSHYLFGDFNDALESVALSLADFLACRDLRGQALALRQRGRIKARQGGLDSAVEDFCRALALASQTQAEDVAAWLEHDLGRMARRSGSCEEARSHFQTFLNISLRIDDSEGIATAHGNLGWLELAAERVARAEQHYRLSLETNRSIGRLLGIGYAALGLSRVAASKGESAEAQSLAREGLECFHRIGAKEQQRLVETYLDRLATEELSEAWKVKSHEVWD